jgi:ethanolamine utilization cobalamin adenosyltransferase
MELQLKSEEYRPSNQQLLQEYELRIQFLSRGCIVHVGCKSIAFETVESAMKEVNEYVNNTYEVQKKWRTILDY